MSANANEEFLKKKCVFPVVLKNETLEPVFLSDEVELRPITPQEREEFFGLVGYEFDFCYPNNIPGYCAPRNMVPSSSTKGRYNYKDIFQRGLFTGISDILASRYVIVLETGVPYSRIQEIDLSFKLLRPTSTGTSLRFVEGETDVGFSRTTPLCGPYDYLTLDDEDIKVIKEILLCLKNRSTSKDIETKWTLISSLYSRALEGGSTIEGDLRYMLLMIALEALYVDENQELSYRLRINAANTLAKAKGYNSRDIFDKLKALYNIRSDIVHKGHTKKLGSEEFFTATELVRESLNLYLEDPNLFTAENMLNASLRS